MVRIVDKHHGKTVSGKRHTKPMWDWQYIVFKIWPLEKYRILSVNYGCIICNPPYGERMGEVRERGTAL